MIGLALLMLAPLLPPPGAVPLPPGVTPGPGEPPWYVPLPKGAPPAGIGDVRETPTGTYDRLPRRKM